MTSLKVSVVICTHNPRLQYMARVLGALKSQSLQYADWELLLIDNASTEPVAERVDLSWHPAGRHVHEGELGLTPARLRGIAESRGEVIVFVDDDNVLGADYLSEAIRIGKAYPFLGAWGGTVRPEFERTPPKWTERYWPWLALREVNTPTWSNDPQHWVSQPCGAGMCVRRCVGKAYADQLSKSTTRIHFDRRGRDLLSGGDTDLALTSASLSLGWGMLPSLMLIHIIPAGRVEKDYLIRLGEGLSFSWTYLMRTRGITVPQPPSMWRRFVRFAQQAVRDGAIHARISWSRDRGSRNALRVSLHGEGITLQGNSTLLQTDAAT